MSDRKSSSSIFRIVQGLIRIASKDGSSIADVVNDRVLVDTGMLRNVNLHNTSSLSANKKNKYSITNETKRLIFKVKSQTHVAVITYAFSESDYDSGNTHTLAHGQIFDMDNLYLINKQIFFSSDKDNAILEVQEWF